MAIHHRFLNSKITIIGLKRYVVPPMTKNNLFKNKKIVKILFETTPDMLTILDKDGKILECNHHFINNFGYQKSEAIGKIGPVDMITNKDRPRAVAAFNQLLVDGIVLNIPLESMRKDKSTFPSIWSGARLSDEVGNIEGFLITGKDLTVIQKLEDELKKQKDEKLILIGNMTARIAHDLRNPLAIIVNGIELLKIKLHEHPDDKVTSSIDMIQRATERIRHQVDDVMDYVSTRTLNLSECSVIDLIESSIENVIIPDNVQIKYSKDADTKITCDENQMIIVFANLILNSIQSIGSNNGIINIVWTVENDQMVIECTDSGPGMSEEIIGKIFEPFFTTKQSGTGLGLVSCKKIMEQHGGTISASNNPTTFTIKLPIKNNQIQD
jgi:PAS domain S-box-containing protein